MGREFKSRRPDQTTPIKQAHAIARIDLQTTRWRDERRAPASQRGSRSLFVKLNHLIENLPLPITLPPARVGKASRLDQAVAIRSLAKNWHNCLARYVEGIDAGTCAVYFWKDSSAPAVCLVRRHGRLGWFLDQVKGPQNVDIEPKHHAEIQSAFSEVGIPSNRVVVPIIQMTVYAGIDERVGHAEMDERELQAAERELRAFEDNRIDPEALDLAEI